MWSNAPSVWLAVVDEFHDFPREFEGSVDRVRYLVERLDDLLVGETQHHPSVPEEPDISVAVSLRIGVTLSVGFYHEPMCSASEVGYVGPHRIFPTKPSAELTTAESPPQDDRRAS